MGKGTKWLVPVQHSPGYVPILFSLQTASRAQRIVSLEDFSLPRYIMFIVQNQDQISSHPQTSVGLSPK